VKSLTTGDPIARTRAVVTELARMKKQSEGVPTGGGGGLEWRLLVGLLSGVGTVFHSLASKGVYAPHQFYF
jgi:hypothetical protein